MGIAGAGAGAAEGLDTFLQRMLVQQELQRRTMAEGETMRHNQATEADTRRGQDISDQIRRDTLANTERDRADTNTRLTNDALVRKADTRPIGSVVTPGEQANEITAGVPSGQYGILKGLRSTQTMGGMAPVGSDVAPATKVEQTQGPDSIINQGTEAQQVARMKENREAAKEPKAKGGELRDTPNGLVRVDENNYATPVLGTDGKPIKGYHPDSEQLVATDAGYVRVPRSGAPGIVTGPDGKPLMPISPASQRSQAASKQTGLSAVDRVSNDIEEADKMGLIGPASGRLYELLAKGGTTGDVAKDKLIGRLKGDLLLTKMHVDAGIGGTRAAASPLLLQQWADLAMKSSKDLLMGYLSGIREDMGGGTGSEGGLPTVGGTFNGGKVLSVTPIK